MGSSKFTNQEICMYYLVNVDHNSMAVHLTRRDREKVFRSAVYPIEWNRLMICCGTAATMMGWLGLSAKMMKALTVKMATVTLIVKGIRL
jgi:hypothetical protein